MGIVPRSPVAVARPLERASVSTTASWVRLDQVCTGIFDCPHSTPTIAESGPLMVRTQDIRGGVFNARGAAHVSEATYRERVARAQPTLGDLLYSREGTYFGDAAEVPPGVRVCLGQRMVLLRPDPAQVSSRFLRYWLNSPILRSHVSGHRDGSVAERFNLPTIRALPVLRPSLSEQRAIAAVLGALDDKIDLNRRMNETLEETARALFKSWFVDFDPMRARAEGRQPFGMDAATAALFPDGFEESDLGDVPTGWTTGPLAALALLNPESWSGATRPAYVDYVDLANTKWGRIEAAAHLSSSDAPSRAQRVLRCGDTIVGTVRPGNGSYALVARQGLTGSTGFAVLRPREPTCVEYVYLSATSASNLETLAHLADGGAYPAVRPDVVVTRPVVIPPPEVLAAFSAAVAPLLARRAHGDAESESLAALRDYLLPKLLSGEVRLRNAEELAEAATASGTPV